MAHTFLNSSKKYLTDGSVDLLNDTIKGMLLTSSHTTNVATQEFIDDVSANEVSGTGYTAGGFTLDNGSVDSSTTTTKYDYDNETLSTATVTARYVAWYKDTGTPGTSPILSIEDFTEDKAASAGDFVYTVATGGLYNVTG